MEVRQRNNNKETLNKEVPNNLVGEQKIKYEKLREQLETPIETRINVNFCLLIYWLPAYLIDLGSQYPTYNGTHIFTDFLSNWGQTVILFHLIFSLSMDLSGEEFRKKWKRIYNKVVQIAVAQSIIVCALFWGLQIGSLTFQNFHEHVMNFVVMIISYTVSEVRFRKRDLGFAWLYGWIYITNTYLAFLAGRDGVYSILTWGERPESIDFPLSTWQLSSYAIWGGMTLIHITLYGFDQLRWKLFDRKQNKIKMQMEKIMRGGS